jgi:hypothetical protein
MLGLVIQIPGGTSMLAPFSPARWMLCWAAELPWRAAESVCSSVHAASSWGASLPGVHSNLFLESRLKCRCHHRATTRRQRLQVPWPTSSSPHLGTWLYGSSGRRPRTRWQIFPSLHQQLMLLLAQSIHHHSGRTRRHKGEVARTEQPSTIHQRPAQLVP